MADRFDLEQSIMKCWNITDDIDMLCESILENEMSQDDISNVLFGLKALYDVKFDRLFRQFEELLAQGDIK